MDGVGAVAPAVRRAPHRSAREQALKMNAQPEATPVDVMIVAGEASGDLHAAALIRELRRHHPELRFFGCGGAQMQAAGCELLVHAHDIAVVGLFEVVGHLPLIYRRYRRLKSALRERRPAAVILVDFPEFNLRLARVARSRGVPVIYFISPQLWAWRPRRVRIVRHCVRRMICIFPFEREFYRRHGYDATYVGHPLIELARPTMSADEFRSRHGLDPITPIVALLPGSRRREVRFHLPTMLEAARRMRQQRDLQFVIPAAATVGARSIAAEIPQTDRSYVHVIEGDAYDALAHARLAVVSSGTATVEAALLGTPMIVVYRLSQWTYRLGRRLVKTPFYAMVNLIAGRQVVPELVQSAFEPQAIVKWALRLLDGTPEREAMVSGLAEVRQRLGEPGAIARAASVVESVLGSSAVGSRAV
jgi:lipid-A-disaccharide synthase